MAKKGKTVLILGNGFDLAHNLPTKYSHFLSFCERVEKIWNYDLAQNRPLTEFKSQYIDNWEIDKSISLTIEKAYESRRVTQSRAGDYKIVVVNSVLEKIHSFLDNNIWYKYFEQLYKEKRMKGENWIDFESEIRFVIKEVDENTLSLTDLWDDVITKAIDSSEDLRLQTFKKNLNLDQYVQNKKVSTRHQATVKDFREKAFEDLERLTKALELYLVEFVEKIQISKSARIPELLAITPDYVISFNYTDTYERIYGAGKIHHIHGMANAAAAHLTKENNMVLGIDEYWTGEERDIRTSFTIFKKFSQRIQKHTGNDSYCYLMEMKNVYAKKGKVYSGHADTSKVHPDGVSKVYIFGHSLDVTDKDILSSFIGDDSTAVTVYCRDKGTEGELIANTIKLIGEEKLLDKSNHVPAKLEYIIQKKLGAIG